MFLKTYWLKLKIMTLYDILIYSFLPLRTHEGNVKDGLILALKSYCEKLNPDSQLPLNHQTKDLTIDINKPVFLPRVLKLIEGIKAALLHSTPKTSDHALAALSYAITVSNTFSYLRQVPAEVRIIPKGHSFYRVRYITENEEPFERKELFHIPFNMLERVKYLRYSLQREPALYLSSSVQLALLETRLQNHNYAVARFETKKEIKIINVDFSYFIPGNFDEVMNRVPHILEFLGMNWPLVAACSMKVHPKNEDNDYKEEYIIPQLLMKYVQENRKEYQAIRFYSTRIDFKNPEHYKNQYNLVLPTKVTSTSGYDENLKKLFNMTDVVNVQGRRNSPDVENELQQINAYKIDF